MANSPMLTIQDISELPNPSLQVTADHKIKLEASPITEPGPYDALIHIKATGVCGSDIHFWKSGCIGTLKVQGDCILGHEASGVVLKCGAKVSNLQPGDRVALEPGVPCTQCFLCLEGRYSLCEEVAFIGVYPHHGSIQRFKNHPAKWCHKLPNTLSFAQGALLEPLSVVLHGVSQIGLSIGHPVLVHGAGPIGLIAAAAARASGAHPIVITDLEPKRLEFAAKFLPSCLLYQVNRNLNPEQNANAIRSLFGANVIVGGDEYKAPRTVLECTGVESSVCTAAYAVRRGGVIMVIGVGKAIMNNLPFMHLSLSEIKLNFINRYRDTWPAGKAALEGGILNLDILISHTFPLEQAVEALTLSSDVTQGSIKVQIIDEEDVKC